MSTNWRPIARRASSEGKIAGSLPRHCTGTTPPHPLHHEERHPEHGGVVLEPVEVGHRHVGVVEDRPVQAELAVDVVRGQQPVVRLHAHRVAAQLLLARLGRPPRDVHRVRLPRPPLGVAPQVGDLELARREALAEPRRQRLGDGGEAAHAGTREADLAVRSAASGPS